MPGSVEELLNSLYDMISDAWSIPMSKDKCVVEKEKALSLIDEISTCLPSDLKQAQQIVESRNDILAGAKREADAIKRQADERARQLVSQEEVLIVARQKANDMVAAAEAKSRELRKAAGDYVDDTLRRTEDVVGEALKEVHQSRTRFKSASKQK